MSVATKLRSAGEKRAARDGNSVGTIGILNVPGGSINVVPGRCQFTLDLRAPTDAQRDALAGPAEAGEIGPGGACRPSGARNVRGI